MNPAPLDYRAYNKEGGGGVFLCNSAFFQSVISDMLILYILLCLFLFVSALDTKGKVLRVLISVGKLILLLGFLYMFVCSLDILSSAFQLVGGTHS